MLNVSEIGISRDHLWQGLQPKNLKGVFQVITPLFSAGKSIAVFNGENILRCILIGVCVHVMYTMQACKYLGKKNKN